MLLKSGVLLRYRLMQKKIVLSYTKEATDILAKLGFHPNFEARPAKRVIQQVRLQWIYCDEILMKRILYLNAIPEHTIRVLSLRCCNVFHLAVVMSSQQKVRLRLATIGFKDSVMLGRFFVFSLSVNGR